MLVYKVAVACLAIVAGAASGCIIIADDGPRGGHEGEGGFVSEGGAGGGEIGGGIDVGGGEVGGGGEGGSATCSDDIGSPAECFGSCDDGTANYFSTCTGLSNFKPAVGEVLVDCLNALNPASCYWQDVVDCTASALDTACFDETSNVTCTEIANGCGVADDTDWQDSCGAYLDGMTSEGRSIVANCQLDICAAGGDADVGQCLADLYPN